jgi:membrane-bound lytic murein transglycosylase D
MVVSSAFTSSSGIDLPTPEFDLSPIQAAIPSGAVVADLDVPEHERVDYWIGRFTSDQRSTFEIFLTQEGAFGGMIRGKLRRREMPSRLLYLAMIESGLRPAAVSRVEAVGVWQFMTATAQAYGLRIDEFVDERRDPLKATDAALAYLERLNRRYGSWYLAASAYNAGPTRIDRALRREGFSIPASDEAYWKIRPFLPFETREYVPRMLAATILAEQRDHHGFDGVEGHRPYEFHRVWVPGGTSLQDVAQGLGAEYRVVKALNPHLVRGLTPPGELYAVRVPVGQAFRVVASLVRDGTRAVYMADD